MALALSYEVWRELQAPAPGGSLLPIPMDIGHQEIIDCKVREYLQASNLAIALCFLMTHYIMGYPEACER